MMNLDEISLSASALRSQIGAQIPQAEALQTMVDAQPSHAAFWTAAAEHAGGGGKLSDSLQKVWPESLVAAIRAAEDSGTLEAALGKMIDAIDIQQGLRTELSQIKKPVAILLGGIVAFLAIIIFLVPKVAKSGEIKGEDSKFISFSFWFSEFVLSSWPFIVAGLAIAGFLLYDWLKSPAGKDAIGDLLIWLPKVGPGFVGLSFGIWAEYLALMLGAGVPLPAALLMTRDLLPSQLREGVDRMHKDLVEKNLSEAKAVDLARMEPTDPRRGWPVFITNAFRVGYKTGLIDRELARVAPILCRDGRKQVSVGIQVGEAIAILTTAMILCGCMMAIYAPVFKQMEKI